MKRILAISLLAIGLTGCANTAAIVDALGKDTNAVRVVVTTVYGTVTVERNIPFRTTLVP